MYYTEKMKNNMKNKILTMSEYIKKQNRMIRANRVRTLIRMSINFIKKNSTVVFMSSLLLVIIYYNLILITN